MDKLQCWIFQRKTKVVAIVCVFILSFAFVKNLPSNLEIDFIDVGQGDCTLIITPSHKNILIDGGGSSNLEEYDVGKKVLLPYLLNHHINKIDMIVVSHFDADHSNGLIYILENITVGKLVIGKQKEETEEYKRIMRIVQEKEIKVQVVKKGDTIAVDSEIYFNVLYPENTLYQTGLNNNSLVLKLNYHKFSMLFTGDIEKETENSLLKQYRGTRDSTS